MRLLVDLLVGINALGAIVGFTVRKVRGARRDQVAEHIRQLEEENRRYDDTIRKIS